MLDCQVNFLNGSGSTVSFISKAIFDTIMPEQNLEPVSMSISDVRGQKISTYISLSLPIKFDSSFYTQ